MDKPIKSVTVYACQLVDGSNCNVTISRLGAGKFPLCEFYVWEGVEHDQKCVSHATILDEEIQRGFSSITNKENIIAVQEKDMELRIRLVDAASPPEIVLSFIDKHPDYECETPVFIKRSILGNAMHGLYPNLTEDLKDFSHMKFGFGKTGGK